MNYMCFFFFPRTKIVRQKMAVTRNIWCRTGSSNARLLERSSHWMSRPQDFGNFTHDEAEGNLEGLR